MLYPDIHFNLQGEKKEMSETHEPVISETEEVPESTPPVSLPPVLVTKEMSHWSAIVGYLQGLGSDGITVNAEKIAGEIYRILDLKKPGSPPAEEVPPTVALPRPPTGRPVAPELPEGFHRPPSIPPLETNED